MCIRPQLAKIQSVKRALAGRQNALSLHRARKKIYPCWPGCEPQLLPMHCSFSSHACKTRIFDGTLRVSPFLPSINCPNLHKQRTLGSFRPSSVPRDAARASASQKRRRDESRRDETRRRREGKSRIQPSVTRRWRAVPPLAGLLHRAREYVCAAAFRVGVRPAVSPSIRRSARLSLFRPVESRPSGSRLCSSFSLSLNIRNSPLAL